MVRIGAFRVLIRTRLNIEPYSPLKPCKVGFIFIGPNSLSQAEDLPADNYKVRFKELRLKPKFLNRVLWYSLWLVKIEKILSPFLF